MLLSEPLTGFFAREREREADRYAVALTQNADAFRRMLVKTARLNRTDPNPPQFVIWMGTSHPTVTERLDQVSSFEDRAAEE
jgi:STE24 endopeptidase